MQSKRITIFAGHYGSGKTNVALNYAKALRQAGEKVAVADLDIVNPYFRTKDSAAELQALGIELVVSQYANSNVDFPAMPKEIYALVAERDTKVVMDVGGDDRGALALGRYVPDIVSENDYEMLAVVNASRPLTRSVNDTIEVLREVEGAAGMRFTGIVNNTNLGLETRASDILASLPYANDLAKATRLPIRLTSVARHLTAALAGKVDNLFSLDIQQLNYQLKGVT